MKFAQKLQETKIFLSGLEGRIKKTPYRLSWDDSLPSEICKKWKSPKDCVLELKFKLIDNYQLLMLLCVILGYGSTILLFIRPLI